MGWGWSFSAATGGCSWARQWMVPVLRLAQLMLSCIVWSTSQTGAHDTACLHLEVKYGRIQAWHRNIFQGAMLGRACAAKRELC